MSQFSNQNDFYSQSNMNSNLSDKKLLTRYKKSNLRSMLPPIEMPAVKRGVGVGQEMRSRRKGKNEKDNAKQQMEANNFILSLLVDGINRQSKKNEKEYEFNLAKILSKEGADVKKYQKIAQILAFIYNQSEKSDQFAPKLEQLVPKYKVYKQWQLLQIQDNYQDTNLGDFIIKIPNPDLLPKQLYDPKKEQQSSNTITLFEALEKYDQLFNTENVIDKNLQNWQKQAFELAFYLMSKRKSGIKQKIDIKQLQQKVDMQFIHPFEYLTKIHNLTFQQYIELKKTPIFKQFEQNLLGQITQKRKSLVQFDSQSTKHNKKQIELEFKKYKLQIYYYLRSKLLNSRNANKSMQNKDKDKTRYTRKYQSWVHDVSQSQYRSFIMILLKNIKYVSQLLFFYPEFTKKLIEEYRNDGKFSRDSKLLHKYEGPSILLHSGGYLNRVSHQGQLKWVLNSQKPTDLLTLLRKFIIYKLTSRGGLFIRSFLSKEENYIFLVIKASQQHLEKMAQQSNFNMQIQLGTIDIFSFQPVDNYGRPLRCNKYLRDAGFIRKYNLNIDKDDRDEDLGAKSVQSQALNIYKKALKMNQDQLRSKLILDQQQCDQHFSWLSHKLNIRYIQADQILNNSYNQQQIEQNIWAIYYIYNKMIIESLRKLRQQYLLEKDNKFNIDALNHNIGLILRLMFLKALNFCNDMYRKYRKQKFRVVRNLGLRKHPLQTIWNQMGEDVPRGYYPYFYSERLQRIWRKFEINEQKQRSKFTPAARLIITNKIIRQNINISKSLIQKLITNYYPIHDPFILKNIKVRPYLNVLSRLIDEDDSDRIQIQKVDNQDLKIKMSQTFVQYQCQYTKEDFTKESMQQKLKFKWREMTQFSVNSVAFYCGEKLAFFFEFRRYLTEKAWPLCLISIIIQILFWIENSHIESTGTSDLTLFNNALMIIMVIINTLWTENTVNTWKECEKKLARSFGTHDMDEKSASQKRVLFQGQMKRNLQTNEINDQQQSKAITTIKQLISLLINLIFIILMAATILIIFTLKGQLYQRGYAQSTVTILPSFLIAISTQIFNFIYSKIIGLLVQFQNKKTIHQYQNSLTSKSFIVTFVVTYFVLFIYGFFQQYFDGDTVCAVKTNSGAQVTNCYYYISGQLVVSAILDLILTIAMAFYPLLLFYITRYQSQRHQNSNVSFNLNYFQSIDCFYEQQDRMQTYMYTDQIDKTWQGYTAIVISFTTLVLFAPIVPFLYVMMFFNGVVSLNAKKYEIIYFSKRTLPIKTKSIGMWMNVIRIISVVGVFVNVALVVYVRKVVNDDKAIVFFTCVFLILVIKYIMSFGSSNEDVVGKRCKNRTEELVGERMHMAFNFNNDSINTDITNVYYNERKLGRRLPELAAANIKHK